MTKIWQNVDTPESNIKGRDDKCLQELSLLMGFDLTEKQI